MGWKFYSGIVTTTHAPISSFIRRIFYVTYERAHVHRTILASFVYTKIEKADPEEFITTLMEDPQNLKLENMNANLKVVEQSCSIGSITDFDIHEISQLPQDPKEIEDIYEIMTDAPEDTDTQYWTRKHFEKYVGICDVSECVCTLTEDEESRKRIREILGDNKAREEVIATVEESLAEMNNEEEVIETSGDILINAGALNQDETTSASHTGGQEEESVVSSPGL
jgi:hypothetical protein